MAAWLKAVSRSGKVMDEAKLPSPLPPLPLTSSPPSLALTSHSQKIIYNSDDSISDLALI